MEKSIYGCISLDKKIVENPIHLIEFVESFITEILLPMQQKLGKLTKAKFCYEFKNMEYRERKFSLSAWEQIKQTMSTQKLYNLLIDTDEGICLLIDFFDQSPGKIPLISISTYSELYSPDEIDGIAGQFRSLLLTLANKVKHYGGYITLDNMVAFSSIPSPHEHHMCFGADFLSQKIIDYYRGYFWGNILGKAHVDGLGGLERIIQDRPVFEHTILENGAVFLQLTESLLDVSDEKLLKLKKYLLNILLPPKEGCDLDFKFNITTKSGLRIVALEQDKKRIRLPREPSVEQPQPVKNQLVVETKPSFSLPDVIIKISFGTQLTKHQKEYLKHIITGWYVVAIHKGFNTKPIHFMHDFSIKDKSVKLEIDFGSAPEEELLDILYRMIIDMCDGEGIIVNKIVQT